MPLLLSVVESTCADVNVAVDRIGLCLAALSCRPGNITGSVGDCNIETNLYSKSI